MSNHKIRFIVDVDGRPRKLFSAQLNRNDGSVYVFLNSGVNHELSETKLEQERLSVHPSPDADGYSVFNYHRTLEDNTLVPRDDPALKGRLNSESYKSKKGFCPLFFNLRSNLSHSHFDMKLNDKFERVCLGTHNPNTETLFLAIFVGHKNTKFHTNTDNIYCKRIIICDFLFVILLKMFKVKSLPFGLVRRGVTHRCLGLMLNTELLPKQCVKLFTTYSCEMIRENMIRIGVYIENNTFRENL